MSIDLGNSQIHLCSALLCMLIIRRRKPQDDKEDKFIAENWTNTSFITLRHAVWKDWNCLSV
jgi:hypothetical protein